MTEDLHALVRTSPKGDDFVGRCLRCGKTGLKLSQMNDPCANPAGKHPTGAQDGPASSAPPAAQPIGEERELLPCPFCGSAEAFTKSWEHENGGTWWLARCSACGCGTPDHCQSEAHAVSNWNRLAEALASLNTPEPPAQPIWEEREALKMVVDQDWLDRKIAADPDDVETEARSALPTQPVDGLLDHWEWLVDQLGATPPGSPIAIDWIQGVMEAGSRLSAALRDALGEKERLERGVLGGTWANAGPDMRWAQVQRLRFIAHLIETQGHVNRSDLMTKFDISQPQASKDIGAFRAWNPNVIAYNATTKRYESLLQPQVRG